jgi:hypothetical protein
VIRRRRKEREAMNKVTSRDGTPIAFEQLGDGPPVIVVCGATCDRALMHPTAEELAKHFTAFNYDRRGRGDSGDTVPYAVEREIEDLGAPSPRPGEGVGVRSLLRRGPRPPHGGSGLANR